MNSRLHMARRGQKASKEALVGFCFGLVIGVILGVVGAVSHLPAAGGDGEAVDQKEPADLHEPANENDDENVEQDDPVDYHEPFVDDDDESSNYYNPSLDYDTADDDEAADDDQVADNHEPGSDHELTEHDDSGDRYQVLRARGTPGYIAMANRLQARDDRWRDYLATASDPSALVARQAFLQERARRPERYWGGPRRKIKL